MAVSPPAGRRRDLSPARYTLQATLADNLRSFTGAETIRYTNCTDAPLDALTLCLFPNASFFATDSGPNLELKEVKRDGKLISLKGDGELVSLPLSPALPAGKETSLEIAFAGKVPLLPSRRKGLLAELVQELILMTSPRYRGNYGIYGFGDGMLSLGHWFPLLQRPEAAGIEPETASGIGDISNAEVAHFEVTLTVPAGVEVVTTGSRVDRRTTKGKQVLHYYAGYCRDFAVQCSHAYKSAAKKVAGVTVNSHYLPEHAADGRRVLDIAAACVRFFNRKFGRHAYQELDVVEAPLIGGAGGMEYPGLVTISSMLYGSGDAESQPAAGDPFAPVNEHLNNLLEFVVAHEVAHQWWYAAVGNNAKQHPFVDEALANYSALWFCASRHSAEETETLRYLNFDLGYQMHRAAGGPDLPVNQPASAFPGTMAYSGIVYCKGGLFYRALRKSLGDEAFTLFLRNYYRDHLFGMATPGDVLEAARQAAPDKAAFDQLSDRWLEQTHGDEDIGRLRVTKLWDLFLADAIPDSEMKQTMHSLAQVFDAVLGGGAPEAGEDPLAALEDVLKLLEGEGGGALEELLGALGN